MQMNTDHLNTYKALVNAFAESHRRVNPVINTCLDNITSGSEAIDPDKVSSINFLFPFLPSSFPPYIPFSFPLFLSVLIICLSPRMMINL